VEELLPEAELEEASPSQLPDLVAEHLQQGKLVGWWQGRAEVGQRALGARSILCNPRSRRSLVRANRVKGRESWRPLAPAVLADRTDGMFGGPLPAAADFMLTAWPVLESARAQAPAAVHVDGSARPQAVRPEQARYYETIDAFRERTGVPAVINTSFNLAGRPIVLSAEDAIDTFLQSELDVLVLEDLVVVKRGEKTDVAPAKKDPPEETKNFYLPWLQD
jgi:carbamoyltransferase